ncbi:MAG: hypothetical protein M0Z88_11785 [Actinomycetota bacterium]|nr:hypothetical protein [Actinomycetota bacterium]
MTQQYLVGELSLLLGELQVEVCQREFSQKVACLRQTLEHSPVARLSEMAWQALELADDVCWDSLERADASALICQANTCAKLREFAVCAALIDEDERL